MKIMSLLTDFACYNLDYLLILVIFMYMIYYITFFLLFYIVNKFHIVGFTSPTNLI